MVILHILQIIQSLGHNAGSGGTTTSTPHWTTCTYFAKLGKFVIGGHAQSSAGNKVYLTADKTQVQSANWTIHDASSNPSGIDDMACNDDYLFALSGSWSGSSVWRTSDLSHGLRSQILKQQIQICVHLG